MINANPMKPLVLVLFFFGIVFISGCITGNGAEKNLNFMGKLNGEIDGAQEMPPAQALPAPPEGSEAPLKIEWVKDSGTRTSDGSVPYIYKLKGGGYRLYFCGAGGILSAISSNGLDFQKEAGARISSGSGAESMVCDATVISLPDGKVRMYYKGANGQGGPGQALHKIFSAISSDGLKFQKEGLRIDSEKTGDGGWASVPEAIMLPDGRVRIYYVSGDFEAMGGSMSAVSEDGMTFQKEEGARVKALVDPAITALPGGRYLLLAVSLPAPPNSPSKSEQLAQGIYSLVSEDGLFFWDLQPVLVEEGVYDPSIVQVDENTFRVFYGKDMSGQTGRPNIVTKSITGSIVKAAE
jgi:hypothetical protein